MNHERFQIYTTKDGKKGILNKDGSNAVKRIVLEMGHIGGTHDLFNSAKSIFDGVDVYQKWESQDTDWWCGVRFHIKLHGWVQLCFDGGNLRSVYWDEVMQSKLDTVIGSILPVDAAFPEGFRDIRIRFQTHPAPITPIMIALYNVDSTNAWHTDDVRDALELPRTIPIQGWNPQNQESIERLIAAFMQFSK